MLAMLQKTYLSLNALVIGLVALGLPLYLTAQPAIDATHIDGLTANWPEARLAAAFNDRTDPEVDQGGDLQFKISTEKEASLAIVLVDSAGHAEIAAPNRGISADRIVPGSEMLFPDPDLGEFLYVSLAPGAGSAYVIVSSSPIFDAGSRKSEGIPVTDVSRLVAGAAARPGLLMAVRRLPLMVRGTTPRVELTAKEVVDFFGVRTRGATNVSLPLRVGFDTASVSLDSLGRRQLDAVGRGLVDSQLAGVRFLLEGHTDDQGSDDYNLSLSERRADTVRDYLISMGVDSSRLEVRGYGKSKPFAEGTTPDARALNRRVVILRLDQ